MRSASKLTLSVCLLAGAAHLGAPARAAAETSDPFGDDAEPADKPTRGKKTSLPPPGASPSSKAQQTAEPTAALGPVERLPGSAYPEWTTRGLFGGSLWLSGNMHGMPWPFYPKTGIGVSGYTWIDGGYETITRGNSSEPNIKYLVNQARAVLRVSPTYSGDDFYVQGQAEIVGNGDQSLPQPTYVSTDDLWLRIGQWKSWDVQVGRFEAFEVYHFGMGMDLNTLERQGPVDVVRPLPDVPNLQTMVYRQNGIGNVAVHLYPVDFLRVEALGQYGFDASTGLDALGGRGAAVLDFGWVKIKGSGHGRIQFPVRSTSKEFRFQRGGSGAIQFILQPFVELGANVSYEISDHYNATNTNDQNASRGEFDAAGSFNDLAVGGFANVRLVGDLIAGGGLNYIKETDQVEGEFTNVQGFGALQYIIGKQLFVKFVGAYAKGTIHQGGKTPWDNTMVSARLRLMYLF